MKFKLPKPANRPATVGTHRGTPNKPFCSPGAPLPLDSPASAPQRPRAPLGMPQGEAHAIQRGVGTHGDTICKCGCGSMCCATVCADHAPAQGATYPFPDAVQPGHLTKLHLGIHALGRHYANAHRPCLNAFMLVHMGVQRESRRHRRKALKLASQIGILHGSGAGVLPQAFGPARGPHEATVTPG